MRSHLKATSAIVAICGTFLCLGASPAFAAKGVVDFFGATGEAGGQFSSTASGPGGIAVNQSGAGGASVGDVYVADRGNNRVQQFSASGQFIRAWGVDVVQTGKPNDLGTSAFEICDTTAAIPNAPADCKAGTTAAAAGATAGAMRAPQGIAIEQATGNVYVSDQSNRRVDVYSASGQFQGAFGWNVKVTGAAEELQLCTAATGCKAALPALGGAGAGQFGVQIGYLAISPLNGNVLIAAKSNRRVDEFDPTVEGGAITGISFVRAYGWGVDTGAAIAETCTTASTCQAGVAGAGAGQFASNSPTAIAADAAGKVYALDAPSNRVQAFGPTGTPEGVFAEAQLSGAPAPVDLSVDQTSGNVLALRPCSVATCPGAAVSNESRVLELSAAGALVDTHAAGAGVTGATGIAARNGGGDIYLSASHSAVYRGVFVLGSTPVAPEVTIEPVTVFTGTTATFEGSVNPKGLETGYHFEYSDDGSAWTKAPTTDVVLPGDESPHAVSQEVSGLSGLTEYQVRLVATKAFGAGQGIAQTSFQTLGAAPAISDTAHSVITDEGVTLEAKVNPQNDGTSYHFEYVDQASYEADGFANAAIAPVGGGSLSAGNKPVPVSVKVSGLEHSTPYRYRLVAANATGATEGPEGTFTTYFTAFEGLPDGRVYEQATPLDKNGTNIFGNINAVQAAAGGDGITFFSQTGIPGGEGAQDWPHYVARRGGESWTTSGLFPPAKTGPFGRVKGWSEDLAHAFVFNKPEPGVPGSFYRRDNATGELQVIAEEVKGQGLPGELSFAGATAGSEYVLFETPSKLLPEALEGKPNLYLWDEADEELRLAGALNGGSDGEAPANGAFAGPYDWYVQDLITEGGASDSYYTYPQHAISEDAERVFFTAAGSGDLYMRVNPAEPQSPLDGEGDCTDVELACTVHVSASQKTDGAGPGGSDPTGPYPDAFQSATPDGSQVFFMSREELTDEANTAPEPSVPAIGRANLDGSSPAKTFIPHDAAAGIAVNGEHIYWADPKADDIGRANLDGTGVEPEFIVGADNPQYVAIDSEYVYWTNAADAAVGTGSIGRAKLDGTDANQSFITGASNPLGIDVNSTHIYWADAAFATSGELARANLDGTGFVHVTIGSKNVTGDIAITDTHVYYSRTNTSNGFVRRAKLDGTEVQNFEAFTAPLVGATEVPGLAVRGPHVYGVNPTTGVIARANLDGSEPNPSLLVTGTPGARGLTLDASHLYWSSDPPKAVNAGYDLYRFDADTGELIDVAAHDEEANGAEIRGVIGIGDDGSDAYFVANGVLAAGAVPGNCGISGASAGTCNLYHWDEEGGIDFVARVNAGNDSDGLSWTPSSNSASGVDVQRVGRVSADGEALLFRSQRQLTDFDNEGQFQFYRYDAGDEELLCVSCNPTGEPPVGRASARSYSAFAGAAFVAPLQTRNLSADGNRVFFETPDRLVTTDVNGLGGCPVVAGFIRTCQDVYMWEANGTGSCETEAQNGGCLYLLSTGTSPTPSYFADASPSGDDAFVFTSQQLVAQDEDELVDIYDARVGGGIAAQNAIPSVPCSGEACRPGSSTPAGATTPGTAVFSGPGNARERPTRRCPKGKRQVRRRGKARCVPKASKRRRATAKRRTGR